jgi:hypothetical protein
MQNQKDFLLVILSIAAISLFLVPVDITSGPHEITGCAESALEQLDESESGFPIARPNSAEKGKCWLLAAKKHDDKNDNEAEGEADGEKKNGDGAGGFDRLWDTACCG